MAYCGERDAKGWYCVLKGGHGGQHLSLDNQRIWKGTPGFPVVWMTEAPELPREQTDELNPTLTQAEYKREKAMNRQTLKGAGVPTGDLCQCGGLLVQMGACKQCTTCGDGGSCG